MYKLSGHSLTRGTFFLPETQPMILQERDSSCTLQLSPDGPEIGFNDWILDDDWPEGNYVWRVKSLDDTVTSETRQIGLEHIIKILDDTSLFGEITTADIAGQAGASTVSAKQAVQYILGQQSDWVLGDFEYESVSNPYEFGGETLLDALGSVTETLEDAVWEYDLSVYPFKLHIRHRSGTVSCEMRGGRNLSTLKRSVNRSGMYTRIYPVGKNDLHLDSVYLSKNENVYGRVDKIETDQSKSTKENLQAWAQGRLNKHCEPTVSITISGLELSGETGESLDNLKLNKVCQCPLPEFNTTITERIVKKQWRDRRKEPENVTVNLCNSSADVATIIKEQSRGGGKGAAGQAKQNYLFEANENHLYYEVFDECGHLHSVLEMTTESLRIGFDNLIESTRSEFLMTSESLRIQFENEIASTRSQFEMTSESLRIQFENELASTRSELEMTSESLRVQFENELASTRSEFQMTSESLRVSFEAGQSSLRSELQMTASSLRVSFESGISSARSEFQMSAESLRVEFQTADSSLRSYVNQTASSWEAKITGVAGSDGKVTAASIAVAINNAGEGVATINASKIYLLGQTIADQITADYISTKIATLSSLTVSSINCTGTLGASTVEVGTLKFRSSSGAGYSYSDLKDLFVTSVSVTGPVDNVYTLKYYTANNPSGTSGGTFSRAVSSITGAWSGNHYYVTVSPQNQTGGDTYLFSEADEWTEDHKKTVHVYYFSGSEHVDVLTAVVNASSIYSDGAPASGAAAGRHGSTYDWDFTITKGDGTTKTLQIDCSAIYSDARSGYTQGTFTLQTIVLQGSQTASLTLQGSAATTETATLRGAAASTTTVTLQGSQTSELTLQGESQTVYEEVASGGTVYYTAGTAANYHKVVSSGGTVYYTAGTAATYYEAGTTTKYARGDSVTVTLQGSQTSELTLQGSSQTVFEEVSSGGTVYYTAGTAANYHKVVSSGGTVYYTAGTAVTKYKGNGSSVTGRGDSVSIQEIGNAVHFKRHTSSETPSGTWYEIKSSGYDLTYYLAKTAATYYKGNGSSVTGRGDSESITPISSTSIRVAAAASVTPIGSTSKRLSSVTRYKAGTNVGKLYNAGEIATYYKGNGGSFTVQGSSVSVTPIGSTSIRVAAAASVTPIGSTSKRLSSVTRYKAGTNVGRLYNAGEIATYYPATQTLYKSGDSLTYYPADNPLYEAGTNIGKLYNAGTIDSTHYYTKS